MQGSGVFSDETANDEGGLLAALEQYESSVAKQGLNC